MKLYFAPGACSLSPHIALREAGLEAEYEHVDLKTKKTASGADFLAINPKGQVPTLQLDEGGFLTEGPAVVQYIADRAPGSGLAPAAGSIERYRLMELLNFVSTEIHKGFSPLFKPDTPEAYKAIARNNLAARFEAVARMLQGKPYLTGETFTVADGYLFVMLTWARKMGFDLAKWPALADYFARVAGRPAVREAMRFEGLDAA